MYELTIDEIRMVLGDLMILIKQREKQIVELQQQLQAAEQKAVAPAAMTAHP